MFETGNVTGTRGAGSKNGLWLEILPPMFKYFDLQMDYSLLQEIAKLYDYYPSTKYTISLNQHLDFFDNEITGFEVRSGYETVVTLTPTQHITTDNFRALSLENRKCRYADETLDGSFFGYYTERSCKFECQIRHAQV